MVTVAEQLIKAKLQRDRLRHEYDALRVRTEIARGRLDEFDRTVFTPLVNEQFRVAGTSKSSE